jgi:hypothetical protein
MLTVSNHLMFQNIALNSIVQKGGYNNAEIEIND